MQKFATKALLNNLEQDHVVPGVAYAMGDSNQVITHVQGQKQLIPTVEQLHGGEFYDLASLTKVVATTPLILHLIATKQICLDGLVADYLPQFNQPQVTVRHLLTHTSTLHGYINQRDQLSQQQLLEALYHSQKIGTDVGKKFKYTDTGLIFLGEIIAHHYQMNVQAALTKYVLEPLGVAAELTFTPEKKRCVPTEVTAKRGVILGEVHDEKAFQLKEKCASAGLFGTLDGLIKIAQYWLNQTDLTPLGADLVSQQMRRQMYADFTPTQTLKRSLGWDLRYPQAASRLPCLYHTGFTGTQLLCDYSRQEFLVVLTNRIHPNRNNAEYLRRREQIVQTFINEP